jgi:hypothetical protein
VNEAVGAGTLMLMNVTAELSVPPLFVAFSIIDQFPLPNTYVTLFAVLNWTLVLFPVTFWNVHDHEIGTPVVVSLNLTAVGATPDVTFVVKLATGAKTLTLMNVTVELLVPPPFVAFNTIDQFPFLNE